MNLTNLFNFKYLKENMKKSKAIIFLCIFLIPVINVIIYLMKAVNRNIFVPSIYDVSMLSLFGMYVIPVILSIALFSFVYKRRSSDFVMSFPVTKKQIFLSNTLGGIAVIGIMNIVNLVLELIASILLSNVMINYGMLFEMALVWSIGYTFVFVCTNIAVSISANKITTVAVTLLVLFLIPFIHTFINTMAFELGNDSIVKTVCEEEGCKPLNYDCFGDKYCLDSVKKGEYPGSGYTRIYENNYTLPYSFISSAIFIMEDSNISKILLKTFFISIIYVFIGLLLFERKKFEVVETSFKSERMHIFIRSLTLVPFICIYYVLLRELSITIEDLFTVIFMFVLIFTYIIIYDLITRKKIINIFKSLASVIIVGIIITFNK